MPEIFIENATNIQWMLSDPTQRKIAIIKPNDYYVIKLNDTTVYTLISNNIITTMSIDPNGEITEVMANHDVHVETKNASRHPPYDISPCFYRLCYFCNPYDNLQNKIWITPNTQPTARAILPVVGTTVPIDLTIWQ